MRSITPNLWFDDTLEQAFAFWAEVFGDEAEVVSINHGPDGKVLTGEMTIHGQRVLGLNGGPQFVLSEAFSFFVECDDQAEVDRLWDALTADGGEPSMCGWLKDRFGVSWQIIPSQFIELMSSGTPEQVQRAFDAMLGMRKLDVAQLHAAWAG